VPCSAEKLHFAAVVRWQREIRCRASTTGIAVARAIRGQETRTKVAAAKIPEYVFMERSKTVPSFLMSASGIGFVPLQRNKCL